MRNVQEIGFNMSSRAYQIQSQQFQIFKSGICDLFQPIQLKSVIPNPISFGLKCDVQICYYPVMSLFNGFATKTYA